MTTETDMALLKMYVGALILTLNKKDKKTYTKHLNEIMAELQVRLKSKDMFGV